MMDISDQSYTDDNHEKATAFFQKVFNESLRRIADVTVGFYFVQNDRIGHNRTGVLLRIADSYFILTAAHDLSKIVKANVPLYLSSISPDDLPIPLAKAQFQIVEEKGVDFAVIEIHDDDVAELLEKRKYITLQGVDQRIGSAKAMFMLFGYPSEWNDTEKCGIQDAPLIYGCQLYEGDPASDSAYDPQIHVMLEVHRQCMDVFGKSNVTLPRLEGISGCGIWRLVHWDKASIENWKPEHCKLVAIEHGWCESKNYVIGTWARHPVGMIWHRHEELRDAMGLVYPTGL